MKLKSYITNIRVSGNNLDWTEKLNFEDICLRLQKRCPCLKMLILEHVHLSDNLPSVLGFCIQFLPGVKILVFRHSTFSECPARGEFGGISEIEVLDVSDCFIGPYQELQFSKMPQLRVLNFGNSWVTSQVFLSLQNHALNLEELYLCASLVCDDDLIFSSSMFPHLKIICLCSHFCIIDSFFSVLQSCHSLQKIYIQDCYGYMSLRNHPFFIDNMCKFDLIEGVAPHHSHNIDYSCKTNKI